MIIEDNNPNMLPLLVLVFGALYLVFGLITCRVRGSRRRREEERKS